MANRTAIVGIGAVLLVIGLAGIGLEQTGVIFSRTPTTPVAQKSPGPPVAAGPESQPAANQPPKQLKPVPAPPAAAPVSAARHSREKSAAVKKQVRVSHQAKRAQERDTALRAVRKFAIATSNEQSNLTPQKHVSSRVRTHAPLKAARGYLALNRSPFAPTHPVVIRFTFDPARDRPFSVASIHLGDRVRVNVHQVGQVNRRVYFTYSRGLNSRQGAKLVLKTMYSFERPVFFRGGRGYYVIQVQIYPDNRWRIMPRSLV